MTKSNDDDWKDFPADEREPISDQAGPKFKRGRWAPMSEVLETLVAAVHPDRQSDVVSDGVAQLMNDDDGDDR